MSTTVFCEVCGVGLASTAKFCGSCGSPQRVDEPAASGPNDTPVAVTPPPPPATPEPRSNGASRAAAASAPANDFAADYTICVIREVADAPTDLEEGLIYPVAVDQRDTVAVEPRDGAEIRRAKCTAIEVALVGNDRPLLRATDISAEVMLTQARITIASSKFDKGGGWRGWGIGGLALSVPLNAASHAFAARRRRGKMLVGQVRFPWVDAVYAQSRLGFGGREKLRVVANSGGGNRVRVDLTFPNDIDACAIAGETIRRAAAFRLSHDDQFEEAERQRLVELARVAAPVYTKGSGKMAGEKFPTSWPASVRTARFGLNGRGAA
jgi:hypothetical protein